jgi:hypothetical protein
VREDEVKVKKTGHGDERNTYRIAEKKGRGFVI